MRSRNYLVVTIFTTLFAVGTSFIYWQAGQNRREALAPISILAYDLANRRNAKLIEAVVMPLSIQGQTPVEQQEFLTKALSDEISPAGVVALQRHAAFDSLEKLFPNQAAACAKKQA